MQRLRDLLSTKFTMTLEVIPPKGPDPSKLIREVEQLKDWIDALNVLDSPLGKMKMSAIAASLIIKERCGLDVFFNVTCRDRNIIGIQSDLLGAYALGLDNVMALTGDTPQGAKGVFEIDSTTLVRLIQGLNQGKDFTGAPLDRGTSFLIGVATNPGADNGTKELKRLEAKVREGANFVVTQPVYQPQGAHPFIKEVKGWGLPILFGILPLKSLSFAQYINRALPGVSVPEKILKEMEGCPKEEQRTIGGRNAIEVFEEFAPFVNGVHIMPAGDLDLAQQILSSISSKVKRSCPGPSEIYPNS